MFNANRFNITDLRNQFLSSQPFSFIVIDNFLDDSSFLLEVENEIRTMDEDKWYDKTTNYQNINHEGDSIFQSKKVALNIRNQIQEKSSKIIKLFESDEIIHFIEEITHIDGLKSDDTLLGGGIHRTNTDGRLAIHSDFNIHPANGKHRRINTLLYLNSNWCKEYNGELELWSKDMMNCCHKIEPLFNRLVIFRITDDAHHGHPEFWKAPSNYPRLSFAFYYYTDNRPENEKTDFHWALWQKRNQNEY